MKKYFFNIFALILSVMFCNAAFAAGGINTGGGALPFGSNTQYNYGIMPTNLPSSGTYGQAQKAADAYTAWKNAYVTSCGSGSYRVKFDDGSSTVSEGIAYGMLLSVYADDKDLFDGLWTYYKANKNGNGVMNWKISGCSGVSGSNGATDAELDVAMALIIASEQWPSGSYASDAKTMIKTIKSFEMGSDGQTLNGDAWGNTNSCRNPSYFAPAYYAEFAKVDSDNATFWSSTAISASNTVLKANMNSTSGLVSNWCDNSGTENTCGNTGSGANGYGADACRNPWRMAVDYLWHGSSASSAAQSINAKLISFVNGYENQMKGPFSNRSVSNPSSGSYVNGSYTTFALPPMTSSSAQSSLNKCYTAVASLADVDAYFNSTIRCISLFVLTGNFWAPGASGFVFPPSVSDARVTGNASDGYQLTLTMNKTMSSGTSTASNFTIYYNGTAQSSEISKVTVNSDKTVVLTLNNGPQPGQSITLSYNGNGNIKSSDDAALESFTKIEVLNMVDGSETILDDCEDGNEFNNVGGIWFTFNDASDQSSACKSGTTSTISPLTGKENPLEMEATGYDGSGYAVHATYKLGSNYTPYNNGSCASWTNPAYVGIGTWVDDVETNSMDWSSGTGVTFWYKGPKCMFQVIISEVTDYCFHKYDVPECSSWTQITVKWDDLAQPTWGTAVTFSAKHVLKLQWQFSTDYESSGTSGDIWIDEVHILGMPPVALTALAISPVSDSDLADDDCANNIDPLKIPIASGAVGDTLYLETTPTPSDASYPVVFWSSSDEDVVTVDYKGRVIGVGYGEATITARSKMHQNIYTTYTVKVPAPSVNPTAISFEESSYEVTVGETTTIIPTFSPTGVTETGLTWKSSDQTKATVSASGVVTGVAAGEVTITATSTAVTSVTKSVTVTIKDVAVTDVTVDESDVNLELGESEVVTASVLPAAVSQDVTATSANTDVATVSVSGSTITISSVGVGSTTITVKSKADASISTTITVTVTGISVTGVAISGTETSVQVGKTISLSATVSPAAATQTVTWSSSDEDIATVTGGVVTGVAAGTATIKAVSTEDDTKYDEYEVTVTAVPVSSVTVSPATKTLKVDEESQLAVSVKPDNAGDKTVTWSSSDETIATVSADGLVTAMKIGTCTIVATANDGSGVKGECAITVSATLVTSISVLPTTATISTGETQELTATVLPTDATDKTYTWSSSDESVATVANGIVTAVKAGTCTIIATANDGSGVKGECAVTVQDVLPTSITIASSLGFTIGDAAQTLTPTVAPANATDKTVTWTSSDELVATVVDGVVTPVGEGTCTITVTSVADKTVKAICEVSVVASTVAVTSVSLPTEELVYYGQTITLSATITPDDATNKSVTWKSSDETIATVDANGVVTGVSIGGAVITVTTVDGSKTAICNVSVEHITIDEITLSGTGMTTSVENGNELTMTLASSPVQLTATYLPTNATDNKIVWSSSDADVASVSSTGIVSPLKEGTTEIKAASSDGSVYDICTVTVTAVSIESVSLSKTSIEMTVEDSPVELTAIVLPDNATNKSVTWTSSDDKVATVVNGVVTPVGVGTATITATAVADASKLATCEVTVNAIPVTGVSLDKTTAEISVSGSVALVATITPDNATEKTITWSSSDDEIATVVNGVVTGVAAGEATITATTKDGSKTATCTVTVKANTIAVTGVTLSPSGTKSVALNESLTFTATVAPTNATVKDVEWSSSDESVASVADGVLTLKKTGTTTITVTTVDGSFTGSCEVTVTDILATKIIIDNALTLTVGETGTISLTILPADASQTATWESSNSSVATVDATGKVTAVSAGTANITATTTDGTSLTSDKCVVTVSNIAVESVTLNNTSEIVRLGKTTTLTATVSPANATVKDVIWTSSKETVATVDATGKVVAVSAGTTTITAASSEDVYTKATCSIEVVDDSELSAEITASNASYTAAVEGTNVGQYKSGSKSTFKTAIDAAQVVMNNASATQTEIDEALATLKAAEKTFAKAIIANETLIFNAELKQENMTQMSTYWFSFNDAEPGGSSTVTPLATEENPFTMTEPGYNGTGKSAMIEYTLSGSKDLGYNAFVGMGMNFDKTAGVAFDMTGSTGISFWIKSDSKVYFEVEMTTITDAGDYYTYLPAYPEWTLVELNWDDLEQYSWAKAQTWDLTQLTKCQWKIQEADGETGKVWVDEVKILGVALDLPEILDLDALYTAIAEAQEAVENAVVGTLDGNYPQSAVTALEKATTTAEASLEATTQTEVDKAVTTLNKAIADFEAAMISVDRSSLEALITKAEGYYSSAKEGYEEGLYLVGSKAILLDAIDAAKEVDETVAIAQTTIDEATTTLNTAIETFLNSKFDPSSINRTALQTAISDATKAYDSAVEGTGDGQYATGSKSILNAAITAAQSVYDDASTSQAVVDEATSTLRTAIETFEKAKISVDKTTLNSTIVSANSLYNGATEGIYKGNYPTGSKAILMNAITAAQSVANSASASQAEVDAAVTTLNQAIETFKASQITVDKSQLVYQLSLANVALAKADGNTGDGSGQYPASAVATFTNAINYANEVNANSTDQTTINGEVSVLIAAISTFEKSVNPTVVSVDLTELAELISEADSLLDNTRNPSTNLLVYIDLCTRKSNAKSEYEKDEHVQSNVDTQARLLAEAIEAFKAAFTGTETAIEDAEIAELAMYPTICNDVLTFSSSKEIKSITIYSRSGSAEMQVTVGTTEEVIDVNMLRVGTHFAKVQYTDGTVETREFVKQ